MIEGPVQTAREHPLRTAGLAGAAVIGGAALYRHLGPEKTHPRGENYFDIIVDLDEQIREELDPSVEYVMLGGGVATALMHKDTELDTPSQRIIPPDDIWKPQYRPDNGTAADIDILVVSKKEEAIDAVRRALTPNPEILAWGTEEERTKELAKPGAKLKIGVTGLKSESEYHDEYHKEPEGLKAKAIQIIKKDWVSYRLENEGGVKSFAISDVKVELPHKYFEPWKMELKNGKTIPCLHPLVQALCYPSRASHGIRKRDRPKVAGIMEKIGPEFGARLEWGRRKQTAAIILEDSVNDGVQAAANFNDQKNALRWRETKEHLGIHGAALLAARMAIHRQLDTRKFFVQFGQGGWLYDNFLSKISGERQQKIEHNQGA